MTATVQTQTLRLLTLPEAARELRCSRAHLYNMLGGKLHGLPPLPVFHIGRRVFIRHSRLQAWISRVETREREGRGVRGRVGFPDEDLEYIAGA